MNEQEKSTGHIAKSEHQIHFSQLAAYGAGGIIPIALFNIAGILVGLMGNISLGLSAFWLGAILIVPRLWDALSDPFIGHLSDNTRTRWGRRRPYLLIGGILVAVFFVVMWWIPKGDMVRTWFPSESGFQWFQLAYILFSLLLFFTACNIFEIPHGALGMEMTTDYHERTRLFSAKSFVGNLFAMSTPWLFALASMEIFKGTGGNEADGMRYVSLMIAAILIPLSFWWFFKLREPGFVKAAKHEKTPFWHDMKHTATNKNFIMLTLTIFTLAMGFNFVQLLGSYIPIFYVFGGDKVQGATLLGINGTVWAITGLLAVFPLNWISPKMGKRNTLAIAILLMCLAQLSKIVCYNPSYPYLIIIPTVLLSAGMLFFFTLGASMVGDICDEDELKTGYRSEGSYYSVFWWFIKMGSALASFVAGALIVFTMFDETQVTKVDRIQGNIREIRSKVQYWKDYHGLPNVNKEWLENTKIQSAEALTESKEYLIYLEKESHKKQDETNLNLPEYQSMKRNALLNAISSTKSTVVELEKLQLSLKKSGPQTEASRIKTMIEQAIPLTIQTKLEKARMNSFELLSHLEAKSLKNKNSKEHYKHLNQDIRGVNDLLANMDPSLSLDLLDKELSDIENNIVPLTQQTPYTLLMMRVVEIGLPLLLSIFSIFFVLRYSLTEKRSHEIKDLLRQRNSERSREEV
ncbi:MAG: MFS transporter [Bacteroidales bacterium]|jgi:GPH family glycoside/pentoside/hexuronide:cation symporter|nr:MFS transporter [Bacteroidales bacterium]